VIDRHVRLKKAGTNYKACCPFHNEKTPSFNVSPSKQFYHCFGCGAHGNAIGFVMEYSGLTYPDAIRELAQQAGMEVPEVRGNLPGRPAPAQAKGLVDRMMEALTTTAPSSRRRPRRSTTSRGGGSPGRSPPATAWATRRTRGNPSRASSRITSRRR